MMKRELISTFIIFSSLNCSNPAAILPPEEASYFPPTTGQEWEMKSADKLGWNTSELTQFHSFLEKNNTRGLIILKNGRIVTEEYWGKTIVGNVDFDASSQWYWASAGKSMTAVLTGIAQQEKFLKITDRTSDHLGRGWTSLSSEKEDQITVFHQLTMTTGLDYSSGDLSCTSPSCLQYKTDAGKQWFYHNAPYTLLEKVVSKASGKDYNAFCNEYVESKIGMDGIWREIGNNNVYFSSTRDAARFGLLMLNKGTWSNKAILNDGEYFEQMVSTSQNLNLSYGYLWWLNGKESTIFPDSVSPFPFAVTPNAPVDMYSALGKNGQFIDIVPSQNLVIIRLGEAPGDDSANAVNFHDEMWKQLQKVITN